MRRRFLLPVLLVFVLLAPPAASARPIVGIGDQHASSYQEAGMRALHLKTARLALAWDWYRDPYATWQADTWVASVRAAHMRPLITFNRNWRRSGTRQIPSLERYLTSFRALRARYPHVREFSPWNEPNAPEQPFYRKPKLAARYFNAMRSACRRCTVLAGDINDGANMTGYLRIYKRYVRHATVWALHNYKDATRPRGTTRTFLGMVRGPVWLTETGGVRSRGGLTGQAAAVRRIFTIARSSRRIKRVYFYEWRQVRHSHWDSAFVSANGKRRPAYYALRAGLRRR
jgi:polysaccharide biosynthesis protein PslG